MPKNAVLVAVAVAIAVADADVVLPGSHVRGQCRSQEFGVMFVPEIL